MDAMLQKPKKWWESIISTMDFFQLKMKKIGRSALLCCEVIANESICLNKLPSNEASRFEKPATESQKMHKRA